MVTRMFGQSLGTAGRALLIACFVFAVLVARVAPAEAQRGRGIATGIGFGIGAAIILDSIAKEAQREQSRRPSYSEERRERRQAPSQRPAPSLRQAQSGWMSPSDIAKMQASLDQLGYDVGDVDGRAGRQTIAAVRKFQADAGFGATGELTRPQFASLVQQAQTVARSRQVAQESSRTPPQGARVPDAAAPARTQGEAESGATRRPGTTPPSSPPPTTTASLPPLVGGQAPTGGTRVEGDAASGPGGASRENAAARPPVGPTVSTDGNFTEYRGERVVGMILERSSIGRRVAAATCATACLGNARCKAYMSYKDGRCELAEDVERRISDSEAKAEMAVLGIRRTIEAASVPR